MYFCAGEQIKRAAEKAKEKTLFHGSNFFNFGTLLVLALTLMLLLSSVKAKLVSEIKRWQREEAACRSEIVSQSYYQADSGWQ